MLSKRRLSAATRTMDNNTQKVLQKIENNNSKVDELVLGDRLFSDTFNRFRIKLRSSGRMLHSTQVIVMISLRSAHQLQPIHISPN